MIDVGGYKLHFEVSPGEPNKPPIVFESGGGDDMSTWDKVIGPIRSQTGATTIRYDRAGFGRSDPVSFPYTVDSEADALATGLRKLGVTQRVLLVAHSYGGFVATLFAAKHPARVCGMVLIESDLTSFATDAETKKIMAGYRKARPEIFAKNPALVRALDAFPATVARMREIKLPPGLPLVDVVAQHPPVESSAEVAGWQSAHAEFVKADPARKAIFAAGSGHFVMRDKPDVVIQAVTELYAKITAR